jgi:hypothetical protein
VALAEGLPPVTYSRADGFQLSESPEVWIAYERVIFTSELHRITNFLAGIIAPHAARTPRDEWIRLVQDQLGGVRATLEVLTRMEN